MLLLLCFSQDDNITNLFFKFRLYKYFGFMHLHILFKRAKFVNVFIRIKNPFSNTLKNKTIFNQQCSLINLKHK